MKSLFIILMFVILSVVTIGYSLGQGTDANLSPYFAVKGDPAVDSFPLLKTDVKVNVAGVIADVEITQVYSNDGKKTIEAVYVFPLGTKSAIHAMRMKIGNRMIEAKIEEKQKAQADYQKAKEEGKTASLLEQQRPNIFQMNVANIMPGDVVEVTVNYTEMLGSEDGIYQFVFPTVVGPRYTGANGQVTGGGIPYLPEGSAVPYKFDIKAYLKTGLPLSEVWVTSHRVDIKKHGADEAEVLLSSGEEDGGNRDFILKYNLKGNAINSGILLYPGETEKFFLMMLEPPERVDINMIPPREYVFIVDVSGSMNGYPLNISKALVETIIIQLRKQDFFNIIFFAGGSNALSPTPLPATEDNKTKAINMLRSMQGGGGTEILPALNKALSLPKKEGISRTIVIATDGYVNVERQVFDLITQKLGEANFFAFGIGTAVNRYLIEGMARVGRGELFVATTANEGEQAATKFIEYIENPLLTDIKVSFNGFSAYEVEPPAIPDLFAQRPLIIYGKYTNVIGSIKVTGKTVSGNYEKEIALASSTEDKSNSALKYLWAREKIARLADYGKVGVNVKDEVTSLGLKYNLMTDYTSFVAIDTIVRETGEVVTVNQPLPLPQGVSNLAVGGGGVASGVTGGYTGGLLTEVNPQEKEKTTWGKVKINVLFQNYPNPFNPETWIPFQLAEPAEVTILIYDIRGKLVRKLYLGYRPEGLSFGKDRAAYWDGRDEAGEIVSSGVYFYTIKAGNFTDTRKMIVIR